MKDEFHLIFMKKGENTRDFSHGMNRHYD